MEMHSSFGGDKPDLFLVVIKLRHAHNCPSFTSHIMTA